MESTGRDRIIAICVAVAVHLLLLLTFCRSYLTWPPEDADDPRLPQDSTEILFVNEYINLGDMITDRHPSDAPKSDASGEKISSSPDFVDAGEKGDPALIVTSENESPMKIQKKPEPEKQGPTEEELAAQQKAKEEQATRERINSRMKFGGGGAGDGVSGTESGSTVSGSPTGSAGHDLAGRTIVSWGSNSSRKSGTIRVTVTVNAAGEVIKAEYAGGEGAASGDSDIRRRTVEATKATRFSPLTGSNRDQKGTITWRFK